jgi:hypothetical protein
LIARTVCHNLMGAPEKCEREYGSGGHTTYFCVTHKCNFQFISRDFSIRKKRHRAVSARSVDCEKRYKKGDAGEQAKEREHFHAELRGLLLCCFIFTYSLCVELGNFSAPKLFSPVDDEHELFCTCDLTRKTIMLFSSALLIKNYLRGSLKGQFRVRIV